ncbi:MAG: O-antigen polysaccharide polymerase Wzy family protein, partial [Oscillospiraceae bacterium]|nr:O-antigen polysaccharide polymerase Wzy family protein [Oscillospiraceae bacterium]
LPYSFTVIYNLLFENRVVASLFNIKVYAGNSIEHALYGHSLAHTLSWFDYKQRYLNGHGVGSCYIAELYHDFGYIGVFVGNVIYGMILKSINKMPFSKPYTCAVLFSMLHALLLAPRGEYDMFINEAFGIKVMMIFFFILFWDKKVKVKTQSV